MIDVRDPKISYRTETGWVDALTGAFESVAFPHATSWDINGVPLTCSVGVDGIDGWEPTTVVEGNYIITEPDAVIEDVRVVGGAFAIGAPRVTLRRCEAYNGLFLNDYGPALGNGLLMEDCTQRGDPVGTSSPLNAAFTVNGYTCNRCATIGGIEGWHTGGSEIPLMDPDHPDGNTIRLYNCYGSIHFPVDCTALDIDWHGDVFQGFDGVPPGGGVQNIIRNTALYSTDELPDCGASAIIGIGAGHSQPVDFDGIILSGSGTPLHADCGGKFRNIYIDASTTPYFFPVSIEPEFWPLVEVWENVFTVDGVTVDGQPGEILNTIPYGYPGYGPLDPPP